MTITARGLNRATLERQLLLRREALDVRDAVRRVVAIQAQQPASPYVALWNRITSFDPSDLDAAIAEQELVKATLMRITLHLVHEQDYPTMHSAMQPTLRARLGDRRFTESGLAADDADALVEDLLGFVDRPRVTAEIEAWIADRLDVAPRGVWWALRSFTPLVHAPTGGPWSFETRPSYRASGPAVRAAATQAPDDALCALVLHYLEGFGPASVADVAQFAMVQRQRVRAATRSLGDDLEQLEGPDGAELIDIPGAPRPAEDTPAPPRLMAMWDSVLLAYVDRSRIIPPEYRKLVTRMNGDVLPTLLVDGYVAGVWRPTDAGIEASAFHALSDEAWDGLAEEARSLVAFLADREPRAFSRYDHWWDKLPEADVRVLAA